MIFLIMAIPASCPMSAVTDSSTLRDPNQDKAVVNGRWMDFLNTTFHHAWNKMSLVPAHLKYALVMKTVHAFNTVKYLLQLELYSSFTSA